MTTVEIVGFSLALFVMVLGIAGSILPGLPSTPLILLAAIGHKLYFGEEGPSWWIVIVLALITLFSVGVDYLASVVGARKLGATWKGALGAVIGGLIGIFFSLPGIILGPFVGALAFEIAGGRPFNESTRAGMGAVLGLLAGALGKLACGVVMTALFAVNVFYNSLALQAENDMARDRAVVPALMLSCL